MDEMFLTSEQKQRIETLLADSQNLATQIGHLMERFDAVAQSGAVAMILGAIVLRGVESGQFASFEEAAAHYVSGARALYQDLGRREKGTMQ